MVCRKICGRPFGYPLLSNSYYFLIKIFDFNQEGIA